jgi:hypothetical protein
LQILLPQHFAVTKDLFTLLALEEVLGGMYSLDHLSNVFGEDSSQESTGNALAGASSGSSGPTPDSRPSGCNPARVSDCDSKDGWVYAMGAKFRELVKANRWKDGGVEQANAQNEFLRRQAEKVPAAPGAQADRDEEVTFFKRWDVDMRSPALWQTLCTSCS